MAASTQDLLKAFDPTGYTTVTGAQLAQLFDGTTPYSDKGLVVMTQDLSGVPQTPDAATHTKWQNYLWVRQVTQGLSVTGVIVYVWNPAATNDATYLKWQSVTVSALQPGQVVNSSIATGAVTDDKIANVSWGKITGAPNFVAYTDILTGDLNGSTMADPVIAANVVDRVKLKSDATVDGNRAVGTNHIQDASVTLAKLAADALAQIAPVGAIIPFGFTTIPSGWLVCDGSAISRATYASLNTLAAADAYPWGAGNGTTTFNLPDLRGYFLRGWSSSNAVDPDGPRTVGTTQADKIASHTHDADIPIAGGVGGDALGAGDGTHGTHNYTTVNQTPAGATETRPKNKTVVYIIKVQ